MPSPILVERDGRVAVLKINRPEVLNALNVEVMEALSAELKNLDKDADIGCVVLTGSEKAFAAGADITDFQDRGFPGVLIENFLSGWDDVARTRKPMIAAVSGFALGGGCELAMLCDFIIASETAKFGQPEIKLGLIPGMGGTQRLARAVGKAKAADLVLTGRMMDAKEAEQSGLVARVVAPDALMATAMETAHTIASYGSATTLIIKETLARAFEGSLSEGIAFERRAFHSCFGTDEKREGVAAFVQKRKPNFHTEE